MANQQTLEELYDIIKGRKETPKEGSYTNYLFDKGLDKILKKVGEEATRWTFMTFADFSGCVSKTFHDKSQTTWCTVGCDAFKRKMGII